MKFKKAISVILMLAVVLSSLAAMGGFAVSASESTDLITNGGFDTDTTGWNVTAGTLESVTNPANGGLNSKFASGNVAKVTPGSTASWLYQCVKLAKGTYTLKFNCLTSASGYYFGVYNNSTFDASSIIKYTSFCNFLPDGTEETEQVKFGDIVAGAYTGPGGSANRTNTYVFTLTEETDIYFAIRCNTDSSKVLYVDNVSLTKKIELPTELENGDFENDTEGWSVTDGTTAGAFSVVSKKQNDNHQINFTNHAGYFVTGGTDTWLYQGVKLAAGEYTWSFHLDLYGTHNMVGAYKSKSGIGTAAALITADTFTAVKDDGTVSTAFSKDNNKYIFSGDLKDWHYTITYKFTLTEETEVYFAIRGNGGACQYIDNMTLTRKKELDTTVYDFDNNGQFDESFVVSEANKSSTTMKIETKASDEEDHGNVLVLPKYVGTAASDRAASARFYKLMEGLETGKTYKISFDLKMNYDGSANEWLGLAGVTSVTKRPLNLNNGNSILTYVYSATTTMGNICSLPKKFVSYTSDEYTIAPNENGNNALIMWNGGKGWGTYTMEFVAESDTYFFWLENYLNKADMWVDNIQFSVAEKEFDCSIDKAIIQDDTVKSVLVIGNSFAGDTIYEMQKLLDATDSNVLRVGKFGKGAQTASYFASIIENNIYGADFCYAEKGYTGERTVNKYTSFSEVKDFTDWDIILVQAATVDYSDTYRESVVKLVNALKAKKSENTKIYLYVPWASRQDYLDNNKNYASTATQIDALNTYVDALKADAGLTDCTVISVYDELYKFSKYVDNIHRGTYGENDGLHLNKLGQTALSMVLLNKLADVDTNELIFDTTDYTDSKWADNDGGTITAVQLRAMKAIANGAEDAGVAQGDANYDDSVDIRDMIRIKKLTANSKYTAGGDCDSDGNLDAEDLASLRKFLLFGAWTDNDATENSINLVD